MRSYDIVQKEQDLTTLEWGERVNSSGTAGTYLKARTGHGARAIYYKLPRYNGIEFDGHECINELVAARLMRLLEIDHLEYRLIHARVVVDGRERGVWLNSSKNFRKPRERKLSLSAYVSLYGEQGTTPYEVCRAHGWEGQIKQMMLVDYLIANRDRHGSNIEVILSPDGSARLAPIFDNGLSFVAPFAGQRDAIEAFDPLRRVATTNYIGSRFLEDNLRDIAPVELTHELKLEDRTALFAGLEHAAPDYLLEKKWEIVRERWSYYAAL